MSLLPRLSGRFLVAGAALIAAASPAFAKSNAGAAFSPNDPYFAYSAKAGFSSFPGQWHLENLAPKSDANAGLDVNVRGAWAAGYTGKGVVIGIIDDGVDGTHEDIAPNYRADLSKIFSQDAGTAALPQAPLFAEDAHGQAVGGVAAGRGGNGIGITGSAPFAQIAGMRIQLGGGAPNSPSVTTADQVDAFLWKSGVSITGTYLGEAEIHIKNNSWGRSYPLFGDYGTAAVNAIKAASLNNVIITFAAGNSRGQIGSQANGADVNACESVITVGALGSNGVYSYYSSWGSSLFVTAPSSGIDGFGITTTDRAGGFGYNATGVKAVPGAPADGGSDVFPDAGYTESFGGTSSATPLVSGIIALAKQATPAMDVRLAKHALASTSRIVDASDNTTASNGKWITNAGGYHFNPDYGFGVIDATAFVNSVIQTAWLTDRTTASSSASVGSVLTTGGITREITMSAAGQTLEGVEVKISLTGADAADFRKDFALTLTSPHTTSSDLFRYNDDGFADTGGNLTWTFTSNAFWGESIEGKWKLTGYGRGTSPLTWTNYEITFNLGNVVLESGAMTLGTNVKAHSLNLDYADSVLTIGSGKTFTVTDSVNLYGGKVIVAGTLDEAAPTLAPTWDKKSKITVTSGAALEVRTGGALKASRGLDVIGGLVTVASGATLNFGSTGISVSAAGKFSAADSLGIGAAPVTLADSGSLFSVGGNLASGKITLAGGELRVVGNITAPKLEMTGGLYSPATAGVIGNTTLTGALDVSGSSTLQFDLSSTSVHDRLTATGAVTLSGGTALVNLIGDGTIRIGDSFDVIAGTVTGSFASVVTSGNHPFIGLAQSPGNAGTLVAEANFGGAADRVGGSPNMREAGNALSRVVSDAGPHAPVFIEIAETVTGLDEARAVLNAFVPQNGLDVANAAYRSSSSITGTFSSFASRIHSGDIDASGFWANPLFDSYSFDMVKPVGGALASNDYVPGIPGLFDDDSGVSIWVNGNAGYTKTDADPSRNRTKSKDTYLGAAVGADFRITPRYEDDIHVGFFVGFQSADSKQGESGATSETETTSFAPGVYVSGLVEGFEVDAMAAYSFASYDMERDIPALGSTPASKASADVDGNQAVLRLGVARPFTFKKSSFSFAPTASLAYVTGDVDGYTESGAGLANLTVDKQSYDSLQSNLGVRLQQQIELSTVAILPSLSVGWGHEFVSQERDVGVSSTALGAPFAYTARTPYIGRDFMTLSAGVTLYVSEMTRLNIGYDGEFFRSNVPASHRATATFTVKF